MISNATLFFAAGYVLGGLIVADMIANHEKRSGRDIGEGYYPIFIAWPAALISIAIVYFAGLIRRGK